MPVPSVGRHVGTLFPLHDLGSSPSQDTVQVSRGSVDSELDQGASHFGPTTRKHSTAVAKISISWPKIPRGILLVLVHHIFQKLQVLKSPVYSWTTHFTCMKALNRPCSQTCLDVVPIFSPFLTFLPKNNTHKNLLGLSETQTTTEILLTICMPRNKAEMC